MSPTKGSLLSLSELATHFGDVRAVDGVDLEIMRGEVVGLVGESGSGKTTLGRTVLRLVPSTAGSVIYDGSDVSAMTRAGLRRFRSNAQMVFQDPYSSLSPRLRVSYLLTEPYIINKVPDTERYGVSELLDMVELSNDLESKYPHELSGGQARRVGIARALALHPEFLVFDEPTSGLDVSAAAAVLNVMKDLSERLQLTYLIITHNLGVLSFIADRVAIMYLGKIMEIGPTERILDAPAHPYTRALLASISGADAPRPGAQRLLLPGEIPSPKDPPPGCRFHTRCRYVQDRCRVDVPPLEEAEQSHEVACHFWREVRADPTYSHAIAQGE
jgi:oligopeptide/dipeptide ABC transporter ATP-binding protein